MQTRTDIARARRQLWVVASAVIAMLAASLIVIWLLVDQPWNAVLPSRTVLSIALGGMVGAFVMYAVDRERNLHRLAERLLDEQLETERLAARLEYLAELNRERDASAALIAGAADAIAVVDADGDIVRVNEAMERLTSVSNADAAGQPAAKLLRFADDAGTLDGLRDPLRACMADRQPRMGLELQLELEHDEPRWVSASLSPVGEGEHAMLLVSVRDINDRKVQESAQRDLLSMAAHELRTPLTAIMGFTRTLLHREDKLDTQRRTRYLTLISDQSERLERLIQDLLEVSRIDAGRVRLDRDEVDLLGLIAPLVEQFRTRWAGRAITVNVDEWLPLAHADRDRVEEILINLIDNAVKYSPAEAPVEIDMRADAEQIVVAVRDRGAGIPQDECDTLFQKFHRLKASREAEIPGTGLGLYIVKGLVAAHGGEVWVDSVEGKGSTFSFTLPAVASHAAVGGAR